MFRVLELFCGIGGCAAALRCCGPESGLGAPESEVVCALDVNPVALDVYRHNFDHPVQIRLLDNLPVTELAAFDADLWWLSPPCQPFTRRGLQRDDEDPRAQTLLRLLPSIETIRPSFLALENVPGFHGSRTHERLRKVLDTAGYTLHERLLCPTELGIPNRRRRFYLVASRTYLVASRMGLAPVVSSEAGRRVLADFVDRSLDNDSRLHVHEDLVRRYEGALHLVDVEDPDAVTNCFTSAYGRSPVRSGSYLRLPDRRVRRFAPSEIVRLLGFGDDFHWPAGVSLSNAWRLAGNSLSVDVVRVVLAQLW